MSGADSLPAAGPAVVVTILAPDATLALRRMRAAARWADLLEIRLDALRDAAGLEDLVRASPRPVVAACRRATDGGHWTGSETARLERLRRAAEAGAVWVDLELDALERGGPPGARRIGSLHVPSGPPSDLAGAVRRLRAAGADLVKIAVGAEGWGDVARVLTLLREEADDGPLAAHAMGEPGRISRLAGPRYGSALVYAAVAPGLEAAAGQPSARELRETLRIHRMRRSTHLFAVLGGDVARSPSPAAMNAAFEALGLDRAYLPFSCADPLGGIRALPPDLFDGLSVTVPHKATILALLDGTDEATRRAGAANTVTRAADGRLLGANTDAPAILDALAAAGAGDLAGRTAIVVGAGGAARAAATALAGAGARVVVTGRTPARAEAVAALAGGRAVAEEDAPWAEAALVVHATPRGSRPGDALPFDPRRLCRDATVLDVVAVPAETALLRAVRAHGARAVSGREMFLAQAARQLRIWTGREAPADVLRAAAVSHEDALRPVVLVGLRGAGKTVVGEILAERLGRRFLDSDARIEEATGRSPGAILREDGEARFRDLEEAAVREALGAEAAVLALGGGAVEREGTRSLLAETSTVVWLDAPDEILLARTGDRARRPPLLDVDPGREVARLRARRSGLYRALARAVVSTAPPRTADAAAGEIARIVEG